MNSLLWKAMFAFLALPGMVAFVIPLWLIAPRRRDVASDVLSFIPLSMNAIFFESGDHCGW